MKLTRENYGRPAAPVRIIHIGIGNFTRAHQAWYTEHAADADQWGIAGFAGRTTLVPRESARDDALDAQDGLYHLVTQHPDRDEIEVMSAVSESHRSHDRDAWPRLFADPRVSIVTSTITEAGYCRDENGDLNVADPQVESDLSILKRAVAEAGEPEKFDPLTDDEDVLFTAPAKFVYGLLVRRAADAGPITFVPCDNIPNNGAMTRHIVTQAAQIVDPTLVAWIKDNVGFVTTMVDRITPRATDEDRARVEEATGIDDLGLVVTEPFSEWVLSGEFKSPRPAWETMGAKFVDDIDPHEMRKLYLLNGSHSLMAYCGPILGHETVYDAISDERVLAWVNEYWDNAVQVIDLPAQEKADYRQALLERYRNPRIRHLLAQISNDGSQKLPIRIAPTVKGLASRGEVATGATRAIAGWILHLRGIGAPIQDATVAQVADLVRGSLEEAVTNIVGWLEIDDAEVRATVLAQAQELEALAQ